MNSACKIARNHLKNSTRSEFEALVSEAKLTPTQEEILRRYILRGEAIYKISTRIHISERQVSLSLHTSYKSVYAVMERERQKHRRFSAD